jgi:D-glycero-D-manno-heptose 1,7-bisphosphate phosphatase
MLCRAAARLGISCTRSYMIGDRASDVAAGRAAGCRTVFVNRGYVDEAPTHPDLIAHSIGEAAEIVLRETTFGRF